MLSREEWLRRKRRMYYLKLLLAVGLAFCILILMILILVG